MKTDRRFVLQGREGEYLVNGNCVVLNGTVLKSPAKIEAGHKIVFRFYNKKGLCEMIYERRVAELGKTRLGWFSCRDISLSHPHFLQTSIHPLFKFNKRWSS